MSLRIGLAAGLLAASLLLSHAVLAVCPGDAGEPLPPPEKLQASEEDLERLTAECGSQPGYLAYRGAILNALGRPDAAAVLLEQALLLDPQRAGTQIDYAEALAALGDRASAVALLRDVLARPDVPPALRPQLERRLAAIDAQRRFDALAALTNLRTWAGTGWQGGGTLTAKLGRDTNLNSAPAHDSLTLTLPGGDGVLALADRFRPRAGSATLLEGNGQMVRPADGGAALQVYGDARMRVTPAASDTNYQQLQAGAARSQPLSGGFALFSIAASQLRYGGSALFRALRLVASRDWQTGGCRPSLGVEGESRSFPTAGELDGRFVGVRVGLSCSLGPDRLSVALRGGQDTAQADRPGGNQRQTDLRLLWSRPVGAGRLGADLSWYRQQDAGGYSPVLANGASRRINRTILYLEYAYPVSATWSVLATLEALGQRSNVELFDVTGRALYFGLRWTSGR